MAGRCAKLLSKKRVTSPALLSAAWCYVAWGDAFLCEVCCMVGRCVNFCWRSGSILRRG